MAERRGKSLVFNNAGVIFFAKRPTLFHIQSKITCLLFRGTQRVDILDRKDLDAGMVQNVEDAMAFLKRHLPLRYEIKTLRRKEIMAVPEDALREAVLNAVIHRDYFQRGGVVMVGIHRDKVEIVSPGGLIPGLTIETLGGRSLPRNPLIADMFLRADEVEKAGTGIGRIRNAVAKAGLEPSRFSSDAFFAISFALPATPGHVPQRLGPAEGTQSGPSGDQVKLLRLCREPRAFSELMASFGRSNRTKFRQTVLKPMLSAGFVAVTLPEKPQSRFQRYKTTSAGLEFTGKEN